MKLLSRILSTLAAAAVAVGLCAPVAQAQTGLAQLSSGSSKLDFRGIADAFDPSGDGSITLPGNLQPEIYVSDRKAAQYFTNAGRVEPGAAIYNHDQQTACSAGHIVGDGRNVFVITAGHCGNPGHRFYYRDRAGNPVFFGQMTVETHNTNRDGYISSPDIGLIQITNPAAQYTATPALNGKVNGWLSLEEVDRIKPTICRIGATRGYSCGNYLTAKPEIGAFFFGNDGYFGDSGGAVYALIDGQYYPVGIYSGSLTTDSRITMAMELGHIMNHFGLKVYS
ncbi:hypothetical protein QP922_12010 [Corynebacterium sp. MSK218]|uniref:hypothetical protein n=1 Tax=Corynebacterium sp. MSK218 TaxID=3050218 RepID=UPI00254C79B5|nr:hypothetical protein [Corynebacterium sp. MSK218]MDK8764536.1 hypothetical protein [Corynebacterium sp. MSK218]